MNSRSSPSRWKRGLAWRTSARTGKPACSKVLATADPTKPLAPVIKTAVAALTRFRFPIAPELRIEHLDHAMSMFKSCSKFILKLHPHRRLGFDENQAALGI